MARTVSTRRTADRARTDTIDAFVERASTAGTSLIGARRDMTTWDAMSAVSS